MNGRDVSQLAHEEAVAEFLSASEPILVEVKRRPYDTAEQTEPAVSCSSKGGTATRTNTNGRYSTGANEEEANTFFTSTTVPSSSSSSSFTSSQRYISIGCQTDKDLMTNTPLSFENIRQINAQDANVVGDDGDDDDDLDVLDELEYLTESPDSEQCPLINATDCLNPAIDIEVCRLHSDNSSSI